MITFVIVTIYKTNKPLHFNIDADTIPDCASDKMPTLSEGT